jgi:hypothetical protein
MGQAIHDELNESTDVAVVDGLECSVRSASVPLSADKNGKRYSTTLNSQVRNHPSPPRLVGTFRMDYHHDRANFPWLVFVQEAHGALY